MIRPTEEEYFHEGELDAELILSEAVKRGAKLNHVIEYGCGDGRIARFVAPKVEKLTCVDVAQSVLDLAKKQLTDRFHLDVNYALVDQMPKCDFLYSMHVIQHNPVDEQKRIMQRVYDSLKPGGLAMIHFAAIETKPNYKNISTCMCFTHKEVELLATATFDEWDIVETDIRFGVDYFLWGRKKKVRTG